MHNCPLQDICTDYLTGDNRPPLEHLRVIQPCQHWLSSDCKHIDIVYRVIRDIQKIKGDVLTCNIKKVRK